MQEPTIIDKFTSEEQQSTNQNQNNKKKFGEKNKESSENIPIEKIVR